MRLFELGIDGDWKLCGHFCDELRWSQAVQLEGRGHEDCKRGMWECDARAAKQEMRATERGTVERNAAGLFCVWKSGERMMSSRPESSEPGDSRRAKKAPESQKTSSR